MGSLIGRRSFRLALAGLALEATSAACIGRHDPPMVETPALNTIHVPEVVRVRVAGRVTRVPFEDYVLGTALSEVSPVSEAPAVVDRIFEVQAIVARTYALSQIGKHRAEGFDLCDTTHCQLYQPARITSSRFAAAARSAVDRTRGQLLTFGNRPTQALFHADCGGHTAPADAVWGGRPVPYLPGAADEVESQTHRQWGFEATGEEVRRALNARPETAVGARFTGLRVLSRDSSGRILTVGVQGDRAVTVRGEQLRASLNATFGARAVQSTRFEVARTATGWKFAGTGFGHGVGLCQVGAAARARRGDEVEAIFEAYFPGASVTSPLRSARALPPRAGGQPRPFPAVTISP